MNFFILGGFFRVDFPSLNDGHPPALKIEVVMSKAAFSGLQTIKILLCICEELSDVLFRLANVLVQHLWAVDDLGLRSLEKLGQLPRNEGFACKSEVHELRSSFKGTAHLDPLLSAGFGA